MQSSSYSMYDETYKWNLEYIYARCGGKGPTALPPPLPSAAAAPPPPAYCVSGARRTTKAADTCDSIAAAAGVSAAALYMGNQDLVRDCRAVAPGLALCLPLPCVTYRVRPGDTCGSIEVALGLEVGALRRYNAWIGAACDGLQEATDFYGKTICAGPQGGAFTATAPPARGTGAPPSGGSGGSAGGGFAAAAVPPPQGVPVAAGTTLGCGRWHVVSAPGAEEETCSAICLREGMPFNLFLSVNPSLRADDCTASLKARTALCVLPTYDWETAAVPVSSSSARSSAATAVSGPAGARSSTLSSSSRTSTSARASAKTSA